MSQYSMAPAVVIWKNYNVYLGIYKSTGGSIPIDIEDPYSKGD
jgi:hypothetical protein